MPMQNYLVWLKATAEEPVSEGKVRPLMYSNTEQ